MFGLNSPSSLPQNAETYLKARPGVRLGESDWPMGANGLGFLKRMVLFRLML